MEKNYRQEFKVLMVILAWQPLILWFETEFGKLHVSHDTLQPAQCCRQSFVDISRSVVIDIIHGWFEKVVAAQRWCSCRNLKKVIMQAWFAPCDTLLTDYFTQLRDSGLTAALCHKVNIATTGISSSLCACHGYIILCWLAYCLDNW